MVVLERIESRTISGFIAPNRDDFDSLNDISDSIQKERSAWESSGAAEDLATQWAELYEKHPGLKKRILPQEAMVKNKKATLYADQTTVKGDLDKYFTQIMAQLPLGLRADVNNLTDIEIGHMKNYRDAIKPMVQKKDGTTNQLIITWQDFMTASSGNFHDFAQFLEFEQYQEDRRQVRPFLQALESYRQSQLSKGKDWVDSIKRQILEKSLANPHKEELEGFVKDLQGNPEWNKSKISPSTLSWMQLLSESREIDSNLVVDRVFTLGIFPADLEANFKSYLDYGLSSDALIIKRSLVGFRPEKVRSVNMDLSSLSSKGRKRKRSQAIDLPRTEGDSMDDTKSRVTYLSAFDGDSKNGSIEDYVQDRIRIARTDTALREDLIEIIRQLVKDPYGLGAGKLKGDIHYVVDRTGRKIYQMYFRPNKIQGLNLQTTESERYRTIYHIESLDELERLVVVDDLLHHNEFDKRYTT